MSVAIGLVGGFAGAQLLIAMSPAAFRALVPWLLLVASLLFGFSKPITLWLNTHAGSGGRSPAMKALGRLFEFAASGYGGFFGAGLGVIMMAGYALAGIQDLKQANVLKNLMGVVITTSSALTFIVRGEVAWGPAGGLCWWGDCGGWSGCWLASHVPDRPMRILIPRPPD